MNSDACVQELARIVVRGVAECKAVEIEGLGIFYPDGAGGFRFEAETAPQVFLAYVMEDQTMVERLYNELGESGLRPWMDVKKLLPGQNWPRAIETAIETSDFFVACFSHNSVNKRGGFQSEIRYALDCARRVPLEDIFVVPVRLNECRVPGRIQREYQYMDLFADWEHGVGKLVQTLKEEWVRRRPQRH